MDEQENLKLSVTNFGPIAKAEIDLRPLTVFVGPSNTGKSYLAILIYALHKFFGVHSVGPWIGYRHWNRALANIDERLPDQIFLDRKEDLVNWFETFIQEREERKGSSSESYIELPEFVANKVRALLRTPTRTLNMLDHEIAREFGVEDTNSLIRNRTNTGAKVFLQRPDYSDSASDQSFEYALTIKGSKAEVLTTIPEAAPLRLAEDQANAIYRSIRMRSIGRPRGEDEDLQYSVRSILGRLTEVIESDIINPLTRAAYYLPADRTGIMHAHRVVVGSIIAQAPRAGLQHDTPLPQLSGVLADFLEQLIGLDNRPKRQLNVELAAHIEKVILEGEVGMERSDVGYPEFFYRPLGWKHDDLRLMNTSSMVSELTPIVLYLRHVVRPGEVLIIEEPESHLHPKMQVELTRHLAAAVKAGVRVMITTHSEWVLDELANLIYLSELPESRRNGIAGADQALEPKEVGAWLFEPKNSPKGSVIKEIKFDADYAGFRSGFDAVAIGTHNSYAEISDRLEEIASR